MTKPVAQQDNVKEMEPINLNIAVYKNRKPGKGGEILRKFFHSILITPGWVEFWGIPGYEELRIRIEVNWPDEGS